MGIVYDEIPINLIQWIPKQEMFWVATAPLSKEGHVNVSPKGLRGTFHIVTPNIVWYEDMTGSGSETIAHLRENGRITILFHAFEGPPRIVRLFGHGIIHEFGTPEYNRYLPGTARTAGSRAVIVIDIDRVGTSCGYSVPYYKFEKHRTQLTKIAAMHEANDYEWEKAHSRESRIQSRHEHGIRAYWKAHSHSIDGLPSLEDCIVADRRLGVHQPAPTEPASAKAKEETQKAEVQRSEVGMGHFPTFFAGIVLGATLATIMGDFTNIALSNAR